MDVVIGRIRTDATTMKLLITKPTKKQELEHLKSLNKDRKFFELDNNQGHGIDWPSDIKDFEYNPSIYDCNFNRIKALRQPIKMMIERIEKEIKDYRPFDTYEIRITANGVGGEYNEEGDRGVVLIHHHAWARSDKRLFDLTIHELIHLGIEHIVKEKKLTQDEKEKMVEDIHTQLDGKKHYYL